MKKENININDTVRLNSGGPDMKVISMDEQMFYCQWCLNSDSYLSASFPRGCVYKI